MFFKETIKNTIIIRVGILERYRILCVLRERGRESFVRELEQGLKGFGPSSRDFVKLYFLTLVLL